jgi:hypothetical protein
MLEQRRLSSGMSRRRFIGCSACTTATLMTAAASARTFSDQPSVIHIYLPGGLSHLDTFDMHPQAPSEIRGEFRPIATDIPGIQICEYLPRLSRLTHHYTLVRGITGLRDQHLPDACDSGYSDFAQARSGGRPGMGAVLTQLWQPTGDIPTAIDLNGWTRRGYLTHAAKQLRDLGLVADDRSNNLRSMRAQHGYSKAPPSSRDRLAFDGMPPASLPYSDTVHRAWQLDRVGSQTLARYGADEHPDNGLFLRARRLLDAGARYVGLSWGYWDHHGSAFPQLRRLLPRFDAGLSALIEDLSASGRLRSTLIVVGSEFGRGPQINNCGGRDHWTQAMSMLVAGGHLPHAQTVGATDRFGAEPLHQPFTPDDLLASLYQALGINARQVQLTDTHGQEQRLLPASTRGINALYGLTSPQSL